MLPIKRRSRRERSRMAKKKRSAALFEVMVKQEQRRLPRPPGVFKTLYLWFKNRPRPERPAAVAAMAAMPAQEAVITAPFIAPPVREPEYLPPPPPPRLEPEPREFASAASRTKPSGEISFRISYGTMLIATFAVATVVVTAFLAGRKAPVVAKTVLAPNTTEQLRAQPPRANLTSIRAP